MGETARGKSRIGRHMVAAGYDRRHCHRKLQLDCAICGSERRVTDTGYASAECETDFRDALTR